VLYEIAPHAAAAVPALITALQDSERPVKQTAVYTLGKIGPAAKDAVPHLMLLLTDPQAGPTKYDVFGPAAAHSLTQIDPTWTTTAQAKTALPAVLEQLKSRTMNVRYSAVSILGHYADRHRAAVVPALMSAAVDDDPSVRESLRLYELDRNWFDWPEARAGVPVLLRALTGTNTEVSVAAARILGLFVPAVPEATVALLTATTDKRGEVRAAALERLGERKPPAAQMVPAMIATLKDSNPGIRELAAKNLGALGAEARAAVPALAESVSLTPAAFDALWRIEEGWQTTDVGKRTLRALVADLSDKSAEVRKRAVDALTAFGPAAKAAAPALIARLTDPDVWPGGALQQVDPNWEKSDTARQAVPDIAAGLKSKDPKVRERAVSVLHGLGPVAKDAVPALRTYLNDAETKHQYAAIEALQAIGPAAKNAIPDLVKRLVPLENNLRGSAHAALGKIDPKWSSSPAAKELIPMLVGEAKNKDLQTRMAAVETLGWVGPVSDEVRQALAAALKDADAGVRRTAVVAIGEFGLTEEPLLDKAVPLQNDPDYSVREATREAIRKFHDRRIRGGGSK
jgi:HEAT repeat protein